METTREQGRLAALLTDVQPTPRPEPTPEPHGPAQARTRNLAAHIIGAAAVATIIAGASGYAIGAASIEPETLVVPANAACVEGMTAADKALTARERADSHITPILERSSVLYGAILTGSDLDIRQASEDLTARKRLYQQQLDHARTAKADYAAASVLCPPSR